MNVPEEDAVRGGDPVSTESGPLPDLAGMVADITEVFATRMSGDYDVDEFGYDEHFTTTFWLPLWRTFYRKWFRVEVVGAEHLAGDGGALLVANHAGTLPLDALMLQVAVNDECGRDVRMLAADLVQETPFIGPLGRRIGATRACGEDANRLLSAGKVTAVFPEGFKGIGKPFADRYRLQRFGRGGFVGAALRASVPIVPVSIVGSEEIYPKIGDIKPLARLLGLPYVPVTPTFPALGLLGVIPLPTKWTIEFGEPMYFPEYNGDGADDPMILFDITDRVREQIQNTLYWHLARRRSIFLG